MSAYGYDRLIRALYKYRPSSVRALASLAHADNKDDAARTYFADLLRLCALANMSRDANIPRLPDYLSPSRHDDEDVDTLRAKLIARLRA